MLVSSGGIGHNHELVRRNWPVDRLGPAPKHMIAGVPAHVDGRMLEISQSAGAHVINPDRMWHYTEGAAQLEPDLARPRDPDHPGPVVAVARRERPPAGSAVLPRL